MGGLAEKIKLVKKSENIMELKEKKKGLIFTSNKTFTLQLNSLF